MSYEGFTPHGLGVVGGGVLAWEGSGTPMIWRRRSENLGRSDRDAPILGSMSREEWSDAEIVHRVLDGRHEAFSVLVRRYQDVLFAHAVRMVKGRDEAADLVQRAFVNGFKRLGSCREPAKVGGWLFRILSNLCQDHLKSRRRKDVSLEVLPTLPGASVESPEGATTDAELRQRLEDALGQLDPVQREAFVLKHVDGRSYPEISRLLGVSVSALKMRVHRARDVLQGLLEVYR
jgi:RNA polymerase sigma-70 factor (ECF subfamily)